MKKDLVKVFQNDRFGNIRVVLISGKEHFCASDVAKSLGYARPNDAVSQHCRSTVKHSIPHPQNPKKELEVTFIPEGDLYRLITHSKLPSAEEFERWVFEEVLPSIRQHGAYMTQQTLERALTSPDFLIELATQLKHEQEARKMAEITIEEQRPKVLFADSVSASQNSILIRDMAKLLKQNGVNTGEKRFYMWLREHGYIEKNTTKATQKSLNLKVMEMKETVISKADGTTFTSLTTVVTGKGQQYFINKFLMEDTKDED